VAATPLQLGKNSWNRKFEKGGKSAGLEPAARNCRRGECGTPACGRRECRAVALPRFSACRRTASSDRAASDASAREFFLPSLACAATSRSLCAGSRPAAAAACNASPPTHLAVACVQMFEGQFQCAVIQPSFPANGRDPYPRVAVKGLSFARPGYCPT